jgi:hypothetical protein
VAETDQPLWHFEPPPCRWRERSCLPWRSSRFAGDCTDRYPEWHCRAGHGPREIARGQSAGDSPDRSVSISALHRATRPRPAAAIRDLLVAGSPTAMTDGMDGSSISSTCRRWSIVRWPPDPRTRSSSPNALASSVSMYPVRSRPATGRSTSPGNWCRTWTRTTARSPTCRGAAWPATRWAATGRCGSG